MERREFFRTAAMAGTICIAGREATASSGSDSSDIDGMGVLIDATQCIGCRKCEWACNQANELPTETLESWEDENVFAMQRRPDADHYTVVNCYECEDPDGKPLYMKFQCFHCEESACVSACLVSALEKNEFGAIEYDADRCMGCRYCMVACPFQIPAYEYDVALTPKVQKCTFCSHRLEEGGVPACVEVCPPQCLTYGHRDELLALAKQRIESHPGEYIDHVYGEHEAGGTSWLYISNQSFKETGLPEVSHVSMPEQTEPLQHGIFKHFIPQIGLFGVLGMIATLGKPEDMPIQSSAPAANHHHEAEPVKKPFFTTGTIALCMLVLAGLASALWRFVFGLEAATNLNDQFPWGIWIAIDVASGVALAAGGFTTAALVYIFHRNVYHPLVRPALLTGMLGYTFVVIGLTADLGRYYNVWHPMMPWMWSGHSVLFEVGMCVTFYLTVLYIEFLPIAIERFKGRVNLPGSLKSLNQPVERLLSFAESTLSRVMLFFIIAGVVLSCMHQSSLGALMLIAPDKMNPLWYTPVLPLLFLISAFAVGFPMVVFESLLASKSFGRKPEINLLAPLSKIIPVMLTIYLFFKVGDLAVRGSLGLMFDGSLASMLFLVELIVGCAIPIVMLCIKSVRHSAAGLFTASAMVVGGVVLNRINVFLTAYTPLYQVERYMPSVMEVLVTIGLISALVLAYRAAVLIFPVLPAEEADHAKS